MLSIFNFFFLFMMFFLLYRYRKSTPFSLRVIISLGIGVLYGFMLQWTSEGGLLEAMKNVLTFTGEGYLLLLKMLVIPLIVTSLIHAIVNLGGGNEAAVKKMSFLTCAFLLGMTAVASLISILVGQLFAVGAGMSLPSFTETPKHPYTGLVDTLLGMLPSNIVSVMVDQNTVAVVVVAVLLGIAARSLDKADHDKMETFRQLIVSLFAIVKKLTSLILSLTPYGVFALISLLVLEQGATLLSGMLNFIVAMYVAMICVMIMHSLILLCYGIHPWRYFKNASTPLLVAFTTRSSFGTLPVTEETLRHKFKTDQTIATFVPSMGATLGMNACAGVFPAMLVVMALTILQQPLTLEIILMVMFLNMIASLGISGIPGTAYIAATVTLTGLNLPYAIVALVQGVDPIVDMGRTAVNVSGALTTALVVDQKMKSAD